MEKCSKIRNHAVREVRIRAKASSPAISITPTLSSRPGGDHRKSDDLRSGGTLCFLRSRVLRPTDQVKGISVSKMRMATRSFFPKQKRFHALSNPNRTGPSDCSSRLRPDRSKETERVHKPNLVFFDPCTLISFKPGDSPSW